MSAYVCVILKPSSRNKDGVDADLNSDDDDDDVIFVKYEQDSEDAKRTPVDDQVWIWKICAVCKSFQV